MIYGPPGTGKTMLAKATANESKVNFLYCSATEFMEVYVGMGAKRVRELFNRARSLSPSIVFIDEIDSIAYKRKNEHFGME
jgi:ATP-dependent Zn protease